MTDNNSARVGQPYCPDLSVGHVQCHATEEDGGCDVGALLRISETDFIWCGEITDQEADAAGSSRFGWYIVHHSGSERSLIAKVESDSPVLDMMDALAPAADQSATQSGLKPQVRPLGENLSAFDVVRQHFDPLTPPEAAGEDDLVAVLDDIQRAFATKGIHARHFALNALRDHSASLRDAERSWSNKMAVALARKSVELTTARQTIAAIREAAAPFASLPMKPECADDRPVFDFMPDDATAPPFLRWTVGDFRRLQAAIALTETKHG